MQYKLIYEIMAFIWITFLKYIVNRYVVFGFVSLVSFITSQDRINRGGGIGGGCVGGAAATLLIIC